MKQISLLVASALRALTSAAKADFVGSLGTITPSATVAFSNSNVTVSSSAQPAPYNFLDQWTFVLSSGASVASIAATIYFTPGPGVPPVFGIDNLQINLVSNPVSGPPIVSWLTVTTPAPGFNQLVALIPPSPLGAGNYTLQIRGTVTTPGAYSGSVIAQAPAVVPLPARSAIAVPGAEWNGRPRIEAHFKAIPVGAAPRVLSRPAVPELSTVWGATL